MLIAVGPVYVLAPPSSIVPDPVLVRPDVPERFVLMTVLPELLVMLPPISSEPAPSEYVASNCSPEVAVMVTPLGKEICPPTVKTASWGLALFQVVQLVPPANHWVDVVFQVPTPPTPPVEPLGSQVSVAWTGDGRAKAPAAATAADNTAAQQRRRC